MSKCLKFIHQKCGVDMGKAMEESAMSNNTNYEMSSQASFTKFGPWNLRPFDYIGDVGNFIVNFSNTFNPAITGSKTIDEERKEAESQGLKIDEDVAKAITDAGGDGINTNDKIRLVIQTAFKNFTQLKSIIFTQNPLTIQTGPTRITNDRDSYYDVEDDIRFILNIVYEPKGDGSTLGDATVGVTSTRAINITQFNNKFFINELIGGKVLKAPIEIPIGRYYTTGNYGEDRTIVALQRIINDEIELQTRANNLYYIYSVHFMNKIPEDYFRIDIDFDIDEPLFDNRLPTRAWIAIDQTSVPKRLCTLGINAPGKPPFIEFNIIQLLSIRRTINYLNVSPRMHIFTYGIHVILHEFCHILGLGHNHQIKELNPITDNAWNKNLLLEHMSQEEMEDNYTKKFDSIKGVGTGFDPDSIMTYAFNSGYFVGTRQQIKRYVTHANYKLSGSDKISILSAYTNDYAEPFLINKHLKKYSFTNYLFKNFIIFSFICLIIYLLLIIIYN